eukprot:Protomagalhaensia_sp_Gyna_25__6012@NODE_942_length_2374_cov_29_269379_g748_i0_p1_GENE_NODE_942_length_2374_cov_29_269379_g748_i0NODE_942_length_2374_cov_29_269379_g748_i0_p1_ORF_typecomplete_len235_score32_04_NODE_942_length_2374_cov_29_269379_g748_i014932197
MITALYLYGARLFNSRYTLLYSEAVLGALRGEHETVFMAFVAAEPGSDEAPQFEKAAAALQAHLGGKLINVRGSRGLLLYPASLTLREGEDDAELNWLENTKLPSSSSESRDSRPKPSVLEQAIASKSDDRNGQLKQDSSSVPFQKIPVWRLVQSWRSGTFGCYEFPSDQAQSLMVPVKSSSTDTAQNRRQTSRLLEPTTPLPPTRRQLMPSPTSRIPETGVTDKGPERPPAVQ